MKRNDRQECEAVRTTIVGGRPPGSGKALGAIPKGIEVLVKKASVDAAFRDQLLAKRGEAAAEIGLTLTDSEAMMLKVIPEAHLLAIVGRTEVEPRHVGIFVGKVAALMLGAVGLISGCDDSATTLGIQPDTVDAESKVQQKEAPANDAPLERVDQQTRGIRPDFPTARPMTKGIQPDRPPVEPTSRGIRPDVPTARPMTQGIQPDRPPVEPTSRGIRPDRPPTKIYVRPVDSATTMELPELNSWAERVDRDFRETNQKEWRKWDRKKRLTERPKTNLTAKQYAALTQMAQEEMFDAKGIKPATSVTLSLTQQAALVTLLRQNAPYRKTRGISPDRPALTGAEITVLLDLLKNATPTTAPTSKPPTPPASGTVKGQ